VPVTVTNQSLTNSPGEDESAVITYHMMSQPSNTHAVRKKAEQAEQDVKEARRDPQEAAEHGLPVPQGEWPKRSWMDRWSAVMKDGSRPWKTHKLPKLKAVEEWRKVAVVEDVVKGASHKAKEMWKAAFKAIKNVCKEVSEGMDAFHKKLDEDDTEYGKTARRRRRKRSSRAAGVSICSSKHHPLGNGLHWSRDVASALLMPFIGRSRIHTDQHSEKSKRKQLLGPFQRAATRRCTAGSAQDAPPSTADWSMATDAMFKDTAYKDYALKLFVVAPLRDDRTEQSQCPAPNT